MSSPLRAPALGLLLTIGVLTACGGSEPPSDASVEAFCTGPIAAIRLAPSDDNWTAYRSASADVAKQLRTVGTPEGATSAERKSFEFYLRALEITADVSSKGERDEVMKQELKTTWSKAHQAKSFFSYAEDLCSAYAPTAPWEG